MSSSFELWQRLPIRFLKKEYRGWSQLDHAVQLLTVELAEKQKFKCALCNRTQRLEIEHDHDPYHGEGIQLTVYNIRGLVCRGCNWQLMMYEKEQRREYTGWDNFNSSISDYQYEDYIYAYECRVNCLLEASLEESLGSYNYWCKRRNLLDKLDEWKDGSTKFPWQWGFEEIKEKRHGRIRTPTQFINTLHACLKFLAEQYDKDPNFRPSDEALKFLVRVRTFLDRIRPVVETRLTEMGYAVTETGLVKTGA